MGKALEAGQPLTVIMEHWDFLQVQCAMYINSDLPGLPMAYQSTSKPLRCARHALSSATRLRAWCPACKLEACPLASQNKSACGVICSASIGSACFNPIKPELVGYACRCFAFVLVIMHVLSTEAAPAGGLCSG